jgi:hypothetical protein
LFRPSLGDCYVNIDFIDREPFVVLINAATGAGMVLPGRAAQLRALQTNAEYQLRGIFAHYDIAGPPADAELAAWQTPPTWANTRDRSLLGSLRLMQDACWHHFALFDRSLPTAAARQWEGLFKHPTLGTQLILGRRSEYHRPLDLVWQCLMPPSPAPADANLH